MPNIAKLLKDELTRLTHKAVRSEVVPLRKAVAAYKSEIVSLKKRIVVLEKLPAQLKRAAAQSGKVLAVPAEAGFKFSAARLYRQRLRLKLTLKQTGFLLNSTQLTVSRWEDKTSGVTPRAKNLPAIEAFLKLSRREALALLAQFNI